MGKKKGLKQHVTAKKGGGYWKGGKRTEYTYEGTQYTGGRKKRTPNLQKIDGGVINQHGVTFTNAERKALENAVNRANAKRKRMIAKEGQLPRTVGGVPTGQPVSTLQAMGKESDFILSRKSKSMQRFKTKEEYNRYMKNLERVNSPDYITERVREYKRNHMKALENVYGDDAKDVIMRIRMMKPEDYMKLVQSDENLEVTFVYDPSDAAGRLNQMRASLGMKLKEEEIGDY